MSDWTGFHNFARTAFKATLVLGFACWVVIIGLVLHQFLI